MWRPEQAWPHANGVSPRVVERQPGSVAPALTGNQCSGTATTTIVTMTEPPRL
jgi:hypothetical protein